MTDCPAPIPEGKRGDTMPTMQERVERFVTTYAGKLPRRLVEDLRDFAAFDAATMPNVDPRDLDNLQDLATTPADELDEAILDRTI
jgi:hypothetical protein